jgi:hypothetical protein
VNTHWRCGAGLPRPLPETLWQLIPRLPDLRPRQMLCIEIFPVGSLPRPPPAPARNAPSSPLLPAHSSATYLVDVRAGIIVDVEASPAWRTAEVSAMRTMIERVQQRFDLKPERAIGDMAYGAADFLVGWSTRRRSNRISPVWDKTQRQDDTISSSDSQWDEQANEYRCPQGQALSSEWRVFTRHRTRITKANTIIYRASQAGCGRCTCRHVAVRTRRCGRSLAAFMNPRGMSRAILRRRWLIAITQKGGTAVCTSQTHPEARTPVLAAP